MSCSCNKSSSGYWALGGDYVLDLSEHGWGGQYAYCSWGTSADTRVYVDSIQAYASPKCTYTGCNKCSTSWNAGASSVVTFSGSARTVKIQGLIGDCAEGKRWVDNVRMRKYASSTPTASLGAEEPV